MDWTQEMSFDFSIDSIYFRLVHLNRSFNVASFFVLHYDVINFTACNSFTERKTSFGKDKHISSPIIVRLETSEIPTTKLFKINHSVFIYIKIIQGLFELIFVQRMTKISRKLLKFIFINRTTRVFVKLFKSWFHIFIILLIVFFNHFFHLR